MKTKKTKHNFAVFILTNKRPEKQYTTETIRDLGYTGPIYYIIDDQDPTQQDYINLYGDQVYIFDKLEAHTMTDTMDNQQHQRGVVFARNIVWKIAEELKIDYFIVLDDDYTLFRHLCDNNNRPIYKKIDNLDKIFQAMTDFLIVSGAKTICMGQGGDYAGGNGWEKPKRKAMNSFVCATDRPFKFLGRINEDVNAYVSLGCRGDIFLSIMKIGLNQHLTQTNTGGLTELYLDSGTYVKSFFSVMCHPSGVKVSTLRGSQHTRLHHKINWKQTTPYIIREGYKKV